LRRVLADPRVVAVVLAVGAAVAAQGLRPREDAPPPVPTPTPVAARLPAVAVLRDSLGRGETLSELWERQGLAAVQVAEIAEAASAVFDVRLLRPGTPVEIWLRGSAAGRGPDAAQAAAAAVARGGSAPASPDSVVIRLDRDRTLAVRNASSSPRAELRETPVREVRRTHVGCIESSLYGALAAGAAGEDLTPLALELDRIYGGVVDFYSDLQPGDCVAIVYRAYVRPDGSARLGAIESAELVNRGVSRAAIWFEAPDGTSDWYDADGNSLRRQFLRSPLKFTRISSGFSMRRFHPLLKRYRAHPGIDYAAPAGTPVQAAGNGVVAFAGWQRGYGNMVEIKHGKVYTTSYAHLSRVAKGVRRGSRVSQGDVIGFVGSTGLATGPHLDYRFSKNGRFVNPLRENFTSGDPVAPQYLALFAERRDRLMEPLTEIYRTVLVDRGASPDTPLPAAIPLLGAALPIQPSVGDD
jgi:murein DD-endopeptidase MepM/ murein hydrolase activator NlpD